MVGMPGFEPGTSASRTLRANQTALHPEGKVSLPVARVGLRGRSARREELATLKVGLDTYGVLLLEITPAD